MTYPARVRVSLAESRAAGWTWAEAWAVVMDEDPLEDFMEGYFPDGRDSEGDDFPTWHERLWKAAYERKAAGRGQKRVLLHPYGEASEALRRPHTASQADVQREHVARCRWGVHCERPATHGKFGHFCAEHYADLTPAVEAFERDEAERSEALGNRQVAA